MRRVVVDTNVFVSFALRRHSTPGEALAAVLKDHRLLLSDDVLAEYERVLDYPKLARYLPAPSRLTLTRSVAAAAERIAITERLTVCRDPADDKFLELAVCGNADCIVSGDRDLLDIGRFRGVLIVTPKQFVDTG